MPKILTVPIYQELIQAIQKELREGMRLAEEALQRRRVVVYWNIGRHINHYLSHVNGNRRSEMPHLQKIADSLNYGLDAVRKILKFYRCYPQLSSKPSLSWAQYRALLTAGDKQRPFLERRAIKEGISSERIYEIISSRRKEQKGLMGNGESGALAGFRLKEIRGRLFQYKTLQSKHLGLKRGERMVDCGFGIRKKVDVGLKSKLTGGTIVRSVKTDGGYQLKQAATKEAALHTYIAKVERVVDGDTLLVTIDVGFDIWIDLRLRLRGIDAPEMTTAAGRCARQFVIDRLKSPKFVVLKTYRPDKYGRYLTDVFYSRGQKDQQKVAQEGCFLNQDLLDRQLAKIY